jgi:hypothetical protein
MASGGARNRSGPKQDPNSLRGEKRAPLRVLPFEPFDQDAPEIPIPGPTSREVELWKAAWRAPQAWAWIDESWRWQTIALWVRRAALAESKDANASEINAVIRLADQVGMTPAGLKENGWTIGSASKPAAVPDGQSDKAAGRKSAKSRFTVIDGDGDSA